MKRRRRVGLLGGSFNPAHAGHLHISAQALERLRLDEIWWVVSPQNPLKPTAGMAPFAQRLATARRLARDPRIRISDAERRLGTRFTVDTVRALKARHPDCAFVWIMGADNLVQIPRWKSWRTLFRTVAIAVFARPTYAFRALSSRAARRFRTARAAQGLAGTLAHRPPPAWAFVRGPMSTASATRIRAGRRPARRRKVGADDAATETMTESIGRGEP